MTTEKEIMWRIYHLSKASLSFEFNLISICVREFGPRNEKSGIWEASSRSYNTDKQYLIATNENERKDIKDWWWFCVSILVSVRVVIETDKFFWPALGTV